VFVRDFFVTFKKIEIRFLAKKLKSAHFVKIHFMREKQMFEFENKSINFTFGVKVIKKIS